MRKKIIIGAAVVVAVVGIVALVALPARRGPRIGSGTWFTQQPEGPEEMASDARKREKGSGRPYDDRYTNGIPGRGPRPKPVKPVYPTHWEAIKAPGSGSARQAAAEGPKAADEPEPAARPPRAPVATVTPPAEDEPGTAEAYRSALESARRRAEEKKLDRALSLHGNVKRPEIEKETTTRKSGPAYYRKGGKSYTITGLETASRPTRLDPKRSLRADPTKSYGPYDELWVVEKARSGEVTPLMKPADVTQGTLRAKLPNQSQEIPLPLKHTDVKGRVSGFVATVDVTQQYHNPYGVKIEAVYVFPLPQNSAVTDFLMVIGDRRIRGVIREREEATRIYREARRAGHVAALLTQERPNIFTQRVANIEPKKEIDVRISYFSTLKYSEGEYEFVFPMVVGPRFNPPGSTDGVGAVGRGSRGTSGQATEVQYLKPGERSGHDISLALDIDAGVEIENLKSRSHVVEIQRPTTSTAKLRLGKLDTIPNKDFVLRYKVAGRTMKTAMLTHRAEKTNTFALMLQPPADMRELPRMPREMVFVLDCSGSMSGRPIAKAKEAMRRCLRKLGDDDTFQIIRFSNRASALGAAPVPATEENVRKGLAYLETLNSGGGTMMIEGIKAALDFPHDERRFRIVSFMTDGYIGNERQIFAETAKRLGASRIFSFGVGNSVNRHLLEGLARMGKGAVAYVGLSDGATEAVDMFYDRASRPALTDIRVDWGGMEVEDVYPRSINDLFVGRPVLVTGRYTGGGSRTIRVSGRCGDGERSYTIDVDLDDDGARHDGVGKVWARTKLAHLADIETKSPSGEIKDEITSVSLEHRVICRYTAFLAVDSLRKTEGDHGISVAVPVPVPDGVRYDTTVSE